MVPSFNVPSYGNHLYQHLQHPTGPIPQIDLEDHISIPVSSKSFPISNAETELQSLQLAPSSVATNLYPHLALLL